MSDQDERVDELDEGYVPPDPDEPAPIDLAAAVGDVRPWGTLLLVLSYAVVFAAMALRGEVGDRDALVAWGANATGSGGWDTAWRLLASTFLHASVAHVFFNALGMAIYGPSVERFFARSAIWVIYTMGGAFGSLASLAWRDARGAPSSSVGASGAIFALGGAMLVCAWRLRHRLPVGRARAMAAAMLFLVGQAFASGFTGSTTDNAAHAAGLVVGLALGAVMPLNARIAGPSRVGGVVRALAVVAAAALAAALVIAVRRGLAGG